MIGSLINKVGKIESVFFGNSVGAVLEEGEKAGRPGGGSEGESFDFASISKATVFSDLKADSKSFESCYGGVETNLAQKTSCSCVWDNLVLEIIHSLHMHYSK